MSGGIHFRHNGHQFRYVRGRLATWRNVPGLGEGWSMVCACRSLVDAIKNATSMRRKAA